MNPTNENQSNPTEKRASNLIIRFSSLIAAILMVAALLVALAVTAPKVLASDDVIISEAQMAALSAAPGFSSSETISFQGELTQVSGGATVPDGNYKMRFAIYDASSGGNKQWPSGDYEEQTVAVSGGLFNAHLGAVEDGINAAFSIRGNRYLQVWACTSAGTGCSSFDDLGRLPISGVAFAAHSEMAETLTRPGFITTTIDSPGVEGKYVAMTIGVDGLPVMSYIDDYIHTLKVTHCNDLACTHVTTTTVDSAWVVGDTDITIGSDGLPIISYYVVDTTSYYKFLFVAHCNDLICSSTTKTQLNQVGSTDSASIVIGANGLAVIPYNGNNIPSNLYAAFCANIQCTSATSQLLDNAYYSWDYAIAIDPSSGHPAISYLTNGDLKLAVCNDSSCTSVYTTTLDSGYPVGKIDIEFGTDGYPLITFGKNASPGINPWVIHCENSLCTSQTETSLVPSALNTSSDTEIALGIDGLAIFIISDSDSNKVSIARCRDFDCSSSTYTKVINNSFGNEAGENISFAIGTDGLPIIAYYDPTQMDLVVIHCANRWCTPYTRP